MTELWLGTITQPLVLSNTQHLNCANIYSELKGIEQWTPIPLLYISLKIWIKINIKIKHE